MREEEKEMNFEQNETLKAINTGMSEELLGGMKEKLRRLVLLFCGLTIAHLGVTLFILANLGADPFNVFVQGLRLLIGSSLTHGSIHMCVSFLIILILLFVDRTYIKAGTLICMICGGPIIDFFTWVLSVFEIGSAAIAVKIPVLILGCVILAFGMTIVIRSEAGTGPNDLVAVVISEKGKFKFGLTRVITDGLFVLIGFILGGKFGIGTIICAFLVGFVADFFMPYSDRIVKSSFRHLLGKGCV